MQTDFVPAQGQQELVDVLQQQAIGYAGVELITCFLRDILCLDKLCLGRIKC